MSLAVVGAGARYRVITVYTIWYRVQLGSKLELLGLFFSITDSLFGIRYDIYLN